MTTRILWLLAAGMLCVLSPPAMAQKVHAVLVGDTNDFKIGDGVAGNLNLVRGLLNAAKNGGQIDMEILVVSGDAFTCSNINKAVADLNVGPTDTVFFYYAAHGYRTAQTPTKFPDFDCKRPGDAAGASAGMSAVVQTISDVKKPQFLIAIADTCNELLPSAPFAEGKSIAGVEPAAWRRLFLRYKGKLLLSGVTPGPKQYSWYWTGGPDASGVFTRQFLDAVRGTMQKVAEEGNPELARWSTIYRASIRNIIVDKTGKLQQPQGEKYLVLLPPKP